MAGNLLAAYLVIRSPKVQTWLAQRTAAYISKEIGTRVSIGGLDISWFMDIELEQFKIEDKHDSILVYAPSLQIDINNFNIKRKIIDLNSIGIKRANINLKQYPGDSTFNYAFLADYFSGKPQTNSKPWLISVDKIKLDKCAILYSTGHKLIKRNINNSDFESIDFSHLYFTDIDFLADQISFYGDSIKLNIHNLAGNESSGFKLYQLMGALTIKPGILKVTGLKIKTPGSDIQTDISFKYKSTAALAHFIDSVKIDSKFNPSILDLNEIRYFAPEISGMSNLISFNGNVRGTISSLKAREFHFGFGNNSSFDGEINLDGLPDINETFIHLKVKKLTTEYYDLANIRLPGKKTIALPEELKNIGTIDIRGFFTGFIYDFVSSADFFTSIGKLETDLSLRTRGKLLSYSGAFNLKEWDLGKTFNISDKVGVVTINSSLNGEISNQKHNKVTLVALVQKAMLLKNEFNDISINGKLDKKKFTGDLAMRDELAYLNFNGMVDFSEDIPVMNFKAVLKNAYLTRLNLWKRDSTSRISTKMDLNFRGSNIDNLLGYLRFDSTSYHENEKDYFVNRIELTNESINHQTKKLSLQSDLLDASFYGAFSFGDFYHSVTNIISLYLPSLQLAGTAKQILAKDQLFEYNIQIKNALPLTEIFLPDFDLSSEASLYGSYNSAQNIIILNGMADAFSYKNIGFNKWYIRGKNSGASLHVQSGASSIVMTKNDENAPQAASFENFVLKAFMEGDSIKYNLNWDDNIAQDKDVGEIAGYFSFTETPRIHSRFEKFNLTVNSRPWLALQENDIIIDSSCFKIPGIRIESRDQHLNLSGVVSEDPSDILKLNFDNLDISNADLLIHVKNVDFDGILNGSLSLRDLYKSQMIEAKVEVKDFAFNKERMGDAIIETTWDHSISALDISADIIYQGNIGTHKPISARGLIYTRKRPEGNFDMDVKVLNYKLASLNPFLRGIASNVNGYASGQLELTGTFDKPQVKGELELKRAQMKIDYLNVTYSFADKVIADEGNIRAQNVTIYDSLGNTGVMDFSLKHDNFRNIRLNLEIAANKMNALNTTFKHNNLFYGKAFGTGKVNISGSFKDVVIKIDAQSEQNTSVYIPINLAVDAEENNFIKFKSNAEGRSVSQNTFIPKETGTDISMTLHVTPNANMQLFLPENIGNIKGNGNGDLQIGVNRQGELSMYGDYALEEGSFMFTLGNVINRVFDIRSGSTIAFRGSPYEADIDLSAVYRLRASLKGLSEDYSGTSVPVDCIIKLKNNLYKPDISFSINLPEANNELNQLVFAEIDTTNQVIMTQQIVSLLVLKTFTFNRTPDISTSVSSSSIEVLTDQLSNMLSQIIKDVDIGVKYRTGDALLTDEEVEVALSTNLFNDRVSIDGNVGMYTQGTTENTSNIVGDVVVDVKITPDGRFRVKAFNKSNPFEMSALPYSPYKQGIGVYYRYEFDRFSDLFNRKKKKGKL
ncbi:MAG TPA: translocation/assembly module TamB domain-containing protein [Lentimicrobium sp.]|nr:translocation/assembly module TamB domain-containing protein [Lentimicrobium sp.]